MQLPRIFQPYQCDELIRLGKANDGGYLVNARDIDRAKVLISFGIGTDDSFEKAFAKINACPAIAHDASVGLLDDIGPDNIEMTLLAHDIIFLKCDIEGAEYGILDDIIRQADRLTGLVIEFHDMWSHMNEITNFIGKLPLRLIHFHANTWGYIEAGKQKIPSVIELTFTASKNVSYDVRLVIPHELDMPNNPNAQELAIIF